MKNPPARFSMYPFLRIVSFILTTIVAASCQFPGFGEPPPCGQSVLKIDERAYQIRNIEIESDEPVKVPANQPDIAYWANQTEINYVFGLSPTPENLALLHEKPESATVTWENCNTSSYTLSAPQAGVPGMNTLFDQSASGITIFVPSEIGGFVIRGEFASEEIQAFDTPDPSAALAEISLLETVASADQKTLTVSVSIMNYGQSNIAFTASDVSLIPENAAPLTLLQTEPALPYEIKSGETITFQLTFSHPGIATAALKILGVEYEIEG